MPRRRGAMNPQEYDLMYRVEDDHWWYVGMRAISGAMLAERLGGTRPARILDAGCGTGRNVLELDRLGEATGIDLSPRAIELSTRRSLRRLARASVGQLPFAAGTFDLVTAFDVLCHGAVLDERASLREFWRVLRPGGWLLLHLPAYAWLKSPHDRAVHNDRRYSTGDVRAMLNGAGFSIERMTYANTLLFPVPATTRSHQPVTCRPRLVGPRMTCKTGHDQPRDVVRRLLLWRGVGRIESLDACAGQP